MRCSSTSIAARLSTPSAKWCEKSSYPTPLVARRSLGLADLVVVVTEDLDQALAVARVDRELAGEEAGVRAGSDGQRRELDQLGRRVGDHLDAEDLLRRPVEDELQVAGVLARRPAVRRALHVVAGDVALHATVERLGVGEADTRDLGRGEDRLRHH